MSFHYKLVIFRVYVNLPEGITRSIHFLYCLTDLMASSAPSPMSSAATKASSAEGDPVVN